MNSDLPLASIGPSGIGGDCQREIGADGSRSTPRVGTRAELLREMRMHQLTCSVLRRMMESGRSAEERLQFIDAARVADDYEGVVKAAEPWVIVLPTRYFKPPKPLVTRWLVACDALLQQCDPCAVPDDGMDKAMTALRSVLNEVRGIAE